MLKGLAKESSKSAQNKLSCPVSCNQPSFPASFPKPEEPPLHSPISLSLAPLFDRTVSPHSLISIARSLLHSAPAAAEQQQ